MKRLPPEAQQNLVNFLKVRPEVRGDIPSHLDDLDGAGGWYTGDGRPDREVQVGFEPAFVVFTVPPFPDAPRGVKNGVFYQPPLHVQPAYTPKGFKVPANLNAVGGMFAYVAWKKPEPERG